MVRGTYLATFSHIHTEFLGKQLANFLGHFFDGMPGFVANFTHSVQKYVPLIAVVLTERIVLAQRKVRGVEKVSRRFYLKIFSLKTFHKLSSNITTL